MLRFTQCLVASCVLAGLSYGSAAAQEPPNGDFEDGVLEPWQFLGEVGVSEENVLEGAQSGFLSTGGNAVGEVCSYLISPFVFPPSDRARVKVAFKVRYKTNELDPFFEDPFHAELVTAKGSVDLLTIKRDGLFWTKGDPTNTRVRDEAAGQRFRSPPQLPPFEEGLGDFVSETPILSVRSKMRLKGCEPVRIKFQICDWLDPGVDSAAFLDEVTIDFEERGDYCSDDWTESEEWPEHK